MSNLKLGLIDRIISKKSKLQNVQTRVTLETGEEVFEQRNKNGEFTSVLEEEVKEDPTTENPENKISNRKKKMVERRLKYGYVLDLKPDLQVANVVEGLYLSQDAAQDLRLLQSVGITHIINIATGLKNFFPKNFKYLTFTALDLPSQNIRCFFEQSFKFIKQSIEKNGKVLVHCNAGISRSSTIVIAYIMESYKLSLNEALSLVRQKRSIVKPNDGFIRQLQDFERYLCLNQINNEYKITIDKKTSELTSKISNLNLNIIK